MTAKEEAMETSATRGVEYSVERVLFLAFELGTKEWKLGFSTGLGQAPRIRSMPAADLGTLQEEIHLAKKRFGLPENARTLSCLPGGRQAMKLGGMAFLTRIARTGWLARYLAQAGIENLVVDSSSIEPACRQTGLTEGIDGPRPIAWMRPNWSPC
jgi:hypothetical protein